MASEPSLRKQNMFAVRKVCYFMLQIKSCSKLGEIQDDIASEVLTLLVFLCHLAVFQKLSLYSLFVLYLN